MMLRDSTNNHSYSQSFSNKHFQSEQSWIFSLTLFFAYAMIFFVGLIANIFVIVVIIKCRRMRTLTNRFLLNLAVSDLIATLVCLPPTVYHHYDKRWIFGEFLCRFVPFMQGTSIAVSIFTLMAVSVDRFIAIHKPLNSKLLCSPIRILITIGIIWFASFLLMIPLILHHRLVDPFDITLTACAEEWHQNMNARLVYDFVLLFLLFLLPLTLMTYCYIRISLSLWFIDSQMNTATLTSMTSVARFSTISEDFQQQHQEQSPIRRQSSQKKRPYYIHYHKNYEKNTLAQQQQQQQQQDHDDSHSLMRNSSSKTASARPQQRKSFSITTTTGNMMTTHTTCRRSSSLVGRRFGENGCGYMTPLPHLSSNVHGQNPIRHRHSMSPYTSGILRTSITSIPSHHRVIGGAPHNNSHHRSMAEFERANRFLQSRRRVVKLLITLVIVFFITRLPTNILSIYIDITSNTYLLEHSFTNETTNKIMEDIVGSFSSRITSMNKKMLIIHYVNPILQLLSLSNSAINPLCYCVMSHAVKHILTLFRQKLRRRGQKKTSSLTLAQRPVAANQSIKMMIHQQQTRNSGGANVLMRRS